MADGVRLQKWLASAGLCSRREGEGWIEAGRVAINDVVVTCQGQRVLPDDRVAVDGVPVDRPETLRITLVFHKPPGLICTRSDPQGRPTIFEALPPDLPRLILVGRLDFMSEGVLLLTSDGLLAHRLMHPRQEVPRSYRVRVRGRISPELAGRLTAGVELDDGPTGPLEVVLDRVTGANSWLTITLREGRNRMVRRIFETLGMEVARLIRVSFGSVELGSLQPGAWRPLTQEELLQLRHQAGFKPPRRVRPAAKAARPPRSD
ncbi:MAG: rRNA pseudouridine synthase [Magnetococcales bacterium]|nr:rRNA pseudouridine synthase [Magnetococcales bacterium]